MKIKPLTKVENNSQRGFTLVEIMVVIALLGITVGVTNDILLSLVRSNNKTQVMNEIEQQSNFVSLKLERELRNARSVSSADTKTLTIETKAGSTIIYTVIDSGTDLGLITRKVGAAAPMNITSKDVPGGVLVSCAGIASECFSITGFNPKIVSISIKFSQAQTAASVSYKGDTTIRSTIVVRNTY
jgi:prepilin-type N-terminal cleavage/methylation domain-containing protein